MKTREKKCDDYGFDATAGYGGFDNEEQKKLKAFCQGKDYGLYEMRLLAEAAVSANQDLSNDIYYSLVSGLSYDKLMSIKYIPISKSDFYAYQRKCLAIFRNLLIMCGKWR